MIQIHWAVLVALCASVGIPLLGVGVLITMADCHHRDSAPPSLKEN